MNSIGLVTTQLQHGGAERQLVQLAEDLKVRGWKVSVLSLMPPQAHSESLREKGISVASLSMQRGLRGLRLGLAINYWRWVQDNGIDIGIYFNHHPIMIGRLSWLLGIVPKVVSSIRCERFGGRMRELVTRWTDSWCTINSTNSRVAAESLIGRRICHAQRLRVVNNGLELSRFAASKNLNERICMLPECKDGDYVWLAAGRLDAQKDFGRLIVAFARVSADHPGAFLLIAGEGKERRDLEEKIRHHQLEDRCRLLGLRTDIPSLLSCADGYILSSAWEGLPNVVIEAQAALVPVVATDVGGVREAITDGVNGIIVPPNDSAALSNGMKKMMEMPSQLRERLIEAAYKSVRENFSREVAFDQWLQLIELSGLEILERKRPCVE